MRPIPAPQLRGRSRSQRWASRSTITVSNLGTGIKSGGGLFVTDQNDISGASEMSSVLAA